MRGRRVVVLALAAGAVAIAPTAALATPAGENGTIVWGAGDDIWRMDADGSAKDPLTDDALGDERPAISADGSRVAWMKFRQPNGTSGDAEIYVMDSDGSNPVPLTDNDDDFDATPAFSPDGETIAWMTQEGQQDIWTMDADDGGNKTNLTDTAIAYEAHPEYSPDGTQIAFVNSGHVDGNPMGPYDGNNIWVMDADGSNPTQLTFGSTQSIEPTWSPDGNQIAFTRSDGLWVMDSDGSNPTQFSTSTSIQYPVWSPDGTMFLATFGSEIYTMSATNPVANFANLTDSVVNDTYPAWATAGASGGEPDTIITKPAKDTTTKKPTAKVSFEADPPAGATFQCSLDNKTFKNCESPKKYSGLDKGKHRIRVRAKNSAGTDPTPAVSNFKVRKA